jgi:hypothetical protein
MREFNQTKLVFVRLVLVLDVVEDIVENKDLDLEVILLVQQVEENLLIVPLKIEEELIDNIRSVAGDYTASNKNIYFMFIHKTLKIT